MVNKKDIIEMYKKGYCISTISKEVLKKNKYISNVLNEKDALKIVESIVLDYVSELV